MSADVPITYSQEPELSAEDFQAILNSSTLGNARPAEDLARLDKMLRNADIVVTARDGGKLVGVSRAITDFAFCCYLSDLGVDVAYQHQGIGKCLIAETHKAAGPGCRLFLIAAPEAETYYPKIGMDHEPRCFSLPREG
ncbi:GNAT family N-acetyltransferase [Methyloligella sp. 2.7D]|uniref:GNAT family N-acetyltransferase n=1 Tax=unclassified Methyloligella TaxID=2625955 RepID=UPI00157BF500|nr:GNAT family N-acetyltransferase [Methyloligella sp. GL2]QKP76231.1 GNAT family N-acetyltransferase [Methyloligella sp. GL2]